jgi:hypothetical protein
VTSYNATVDRHEMVIIALGLGSCERPAVSRNWPHESGDPPREDT